VKHRIHRAVHDLQRVDLGNLTIIRKGIECGARDVKVDPIHRAAVAGARIRLKIVNADAARRPVCDARVMIIDPNITSLNARGRKVYGYDEGLFRRMLSVRSGRPTSDTNRVIAIAGLVAG